MLPENANTNAPTATGIPTRRRKESGMIVETNAEMSEDIVPGQKNAITVAESEAPRDTESGETKIVVVTGTP